MFYTQRRENELIDFLAQMSCIQKNANADQLSAIISTRSSRELKIINRFLGKFAEFELGLGASKKNSCPSSDSTDK